MNAIVIIIKNEKVCFYITVLYFAEKMSGRCKSNQFLNFISKYRSKLI